MNTSRISNQDLYTVNASKENGDTLDALEWNKLSDAAKISHEKINSLITDVSGIATEQANANSVVTTDYKNDTIVNSNGDLTLKANKTQDDIILKTGNNTVATFNRGNVSILASNYKFEELGTLSGYGEKCTAGEVVDAASKIQNLFYPQIKVHYCVAQGDIFDDSIIDQSASHLMVVIQENDVDENYGSFEIGDTLSKQDIFDKIDGLSEVGFTYFGGSDEYQIPIYWNNSNENKRKIKNAINANIQDFYIAFVETNTFLGTGVAADLEDETYIFNFVLGDKIYFDVSDVTFTAKEGANPIYAAGKDMIALVKYFKTGEGQQNGPWANG